MIACGTDPTPHPAAQKSAAELKDERSEHQALQKHARQLETQVLEIDNLNRTITLLVAEKSSLAKSVEELSDANQRKPFLFTIRE
jgi:predicted RNase H-like nuclease (RuvC/YqgF family)